MADPDSAAWCRGRRLPTELREPRSSHLLMLGEFAGAGQLRRCYDAAVAHRYLWHEFGDVHLLLP